MYLKNNTSFSLSKFKTKLLPNVINHFLTDQPILKWKSGLNYSLPCSVKMCILTYSLGTGPDWAILMPRK